ncbi:MAG: hypothetical protein DRN15_05135 [Thermoprotei archaeon]|nr:MAG: hypothetical protein DRN15_05135 [Thermoprotei archaeon]
MGELKVTLDEKLLKLFKERAYRIFGYKKGSLKFAVELAIKDFIERIDLLQKEDLSVKDIRGLLKDLKVTSVELQHRALEVMVVNMRKYRERIS